MKSLSIPLLALTLFSAGALAVTNPYALTSEADVPTLYQQTLPDFWRQHAIEGEFKGKDGVAIRYAALRQEKVDRAILIVNGRVESYLKYQELAWDLWRQGYSLYLIDHRGQGMSGRMLSDHDKGYVDQFDDYVLDLKQFHDQIIMADKPAKLFLLAHSMGGPSLPAIWSAGRMISAPPCSPPPCWASIWAACPNGWPRGWLPP